LMPRETEFPVASLMDEFSDPLSKAARQKDELRGLASQGFETLVLLRVINHGLSRRDGHNSNLWVNMAVCVTFVRVKESTQTGSFYAQYERASRKFVQWAENQAQPFREEYGHALQNVAEQISARIPAVTPSSANQLPQIGK